jgi:hypothetical protein
MVMQRLFGRRFTTGDICRQLLIHRPVAVPRSGQEAVAYPDLQKCYAVITPSPSSSTPRPLSLPLAPPDGGVRRGCRSLAALDAAALWHGGQGVSPPETF